MRTSVGAVWCDRRLLSNLGTLGAFFYPNSRYQAMKRTLTSLLGLAAVAALPLAASAQTYGYGAGASGVISSVNGGAVTLRNGRTIFLKNGTPVLPNGQGLQAGERISVSGYDAGNGNVNAQQIRILGYGGNNNYGGNNYGYPGQYNNGYNNGNHNGYGRNGRDTDDRRARRRHRDDQNDQGNRGDREDRGD